MAHKKPVIYILALILFACIALALAGLPGASRSASAAGDVTVYRDSLAAGWENWSWNTTVNPGNPTPIQSGSASLALTYNSAWAGLYLHAGTTLNTADLASLHFWVNGGSSGERNLRVVAYDQNLTETTSFSLAAPANTWTEFTIPLSAFGSPAGISGLAWQDTTGGAQPVFYLDEISLVGAGGVEPTSPAPGSGPALEVDALAGQHAISPNIYGMNFADESLAAELRLPVRRFGGNSTTRYNWQNDTSNHASDWYFENIPEDNSNPAALPDGSSSDRFVEQDRRTGTKTIMTVPMIGWTPKSRSYTCGFSVAKYGQQESVDPWRTDCGNGRQGGANLTGNDPADTSTPIGPAFVQAWINHFIGKYGTASQGGVALYNLDNEPMLWNSTQRDVHPQPTSYDELRDRTYAYAAAVKAADPSAQTLGPVLWGWTAYFYSALDVAAGGAWWTNPPDRNAHGGTPFVEWYLQQMRSYEQTHGTRILDYFDLHYYPQAQNVALSPAGDAATQARRLRSTRSLWDTTYSDESWIGEPVYLIPRMKAWVAANYPGTKLAMTEYNWGALDNINGALAQADVLGIFGREGLDLATLWAPPSAGDPGAFAFRIYRNYDGQGRAFGETSVHASSADPDQLAIYAARRAADGALTLVVVNKTGSSLTSSLQLANFSTSRAQIYRYSAANPNAIVREPDVLITSHSPVLAFPASCITLVVMPAQDGSASLSSVYLPLAIRP